MLWILLALLEWIVPALLELQLFGITSISVQVDAVDSTY
jgi:hypothetical protein